jgi:hypothetical protein
MEIAASMCIYTNDQILLFTLDDGSSEENSEAENGGTRG